MRKASKRYVFLLAFALLSVGTASVAFAEEAERAETMVETELAAKMEAWLDGDRDSGPSADGQDADQDASDDEENQSSGSSYWKDHFTLHGYLTTAYVDHSLDNDNQPRSSDDVVLGFDNDDTFDYRSAALQLRYEVNPRHIFLVQVSHRSYGDSPVTETEDEVELDWLFYQFNITDNARIKLGRFAVPAGIFNEIRDVGVILPFFRPSFVVYREGGLFTETADGIDVGYTFGATSDWSLEADVYYGEWDLFEQATNTSAVTEAEAEGGGIQLWLNTPVTGLRFGLGGQRYDVAQSIFTPTDDSADWESIFFSIDGSFDRWVARAEFRTLDFPVNNNVSPLGEADTNNWYAQLGFHITDKLSIYGQYENGDLTQSSLIFREPIDITLREDTGVSVVYSFRPNIVLRGEYHDVDYDVSTGAQIFPGPPFQVRPIFTTLGSEYLAISLSLSF